jgi:hypothetical protein
MEGAMIDAARAIGIEIYLLVGIGSLVLLLAAVFLFVIGWINRRRVQASQAWPMVLGRVTDSRVVSALVEGGTTYEAHVRYAYDVDGRAFENGRLAFGDTGTDGSQAAAQRLAARYPTGAIVHVYHNPANPQDAVLERRSGNSAILFVAGVVFAVVGCLLPAGLGAFILYRASNAPGT